VSSWGSAECKPPHPDKHAMLNPTQNSRASRENPNTVGPFITHRSPSRRDASPPATDYEGLGQRKPRFSRAYRTEVPVIIVRIRPGVELAWRGAGANAERTTRRAASLPATTQS
jgi:hypothetical protein